MLSSAETPPSRPLPPAKARRAAMPKSSTPPPAYNFTFPSRRQPGKSLPWEDPDHMIGWDSDSAPLSSSPLPKELELSATADTLIKEREREYTLGSESTMGKTLYQNLSQGSPASSPDGPPHMLMNYSTSDSALTSPHPSHIRRLDRKVTADISLLADQNADLMDKLEKLQAGASSASQTGRREIKRLEKEIAFLRDAFEKTQAKSKELEEKMHGAVTGEAWRKKQEREAKFRAMRSSGRHTDRQEEVKNFAPNGSRFGGPSERVSFFPAATSPNPRRARQIQESNSDTEMELSNLFPHSDQTLISQLLAKVQELEEANAQIIKQQNETATQLSAVQRDTVHIAKAYESFTDPETRPESDVAALGKKELPPSTETVKFRSMGRNTNGQTLEGDESPTSRNSILPPRDRRSVVGLFPHDHPLVTDSPPNPNNLQLPSRPSSPSSYSESLQDRLSVSSMGSRGLDSPEALSPLHFFSPATQVLEMSPLGSRPTLQSELCKELGDSWDMSPSPHHGRTSSLYDLSQFSMPATPSPPPRALNRRASDELNFDAIDQDGCCTSVPMTTGLLRLSVEPPTPVKAGNIGEHARSPRVERMSETLRSRTGRWVDRRFKESHNMNMAKATSVKCKGTGSIRADRTSVGLPQPLSNAIDKMVEKFDGLSDVEDNATSSSPADNNALQLRDTRSSGRESLTKTNMLGNLLFEVWLWFQFAIIILVFIYAMAKRGPKVMLVDSERKVVK